MERVQLKPFVKWAGGKTQLLRKIKKIYPNNNGFTIKKYVEPFVGAGAVLFDVLSNYDIEEIYISDINQELINTYEMIQSNVNELITVLEKFQNEYLTLNIQEKRKYYYEKRSIFNDLIKIENETENIKKAALFIFLNKTCFNGLYRVNKTGEFNVPIGDYEKPIICDKKNLMNISNALKKVNIVLGDYKKSSDFIDKNTFVYFDPPYRPLNKTSSFTSYTQEDFDDIKQQELAEYVKKIVEKDAKVIISNSDPKNSDEKDCFFDLLYKDYRIKRVLANRAINSNSEKRGRIYELLIYNFKTQRGNDSMRDFDPWICNFKKAIATHGYYVDFGKVYFNVDDIKVELNILNSLINSENIENDFTNLVEKYPETLKCIPILLAVRKQEIIVIDEGEEKEISFKKMNYSIDEYINFMRKTGLFDLLENHLINNLIDYVTGVEVGLSSNGRKNRGGHLMEDIVEDLIIRDGFEKNVSYFKEMYISQIEQKWDIDLSAISNNGKVEKRFDFVIKTNDMIYVVETNFYASSGSKLNETARSYKTLAQEIDTIDGVTFVWFTDGGGWFKARHNLEETFDVMDNIYNINDMKNGLSKLIFK